MKIPFTKMHGAGNDFIVVDDRTLGFPIDDKIFIRWISTRHTGVGCDGVLLLQTSKIADVRMRFINPDGSEQDMCGNGARCMARFAHELGITSTEMTMQTGAGVVNAIVYDDRVCIELTAPVDLKQDVKVDLEEQVDFVNTGVPHAVVWVADPSALKIAKVGRIIRNHALFTPNGTNVNFARVEPDGSLTMRTYERGVEAETLACGTGATAVALLAFERGWVNLPVAVHCAGSFDLVIDSVQKIPTLTGAAEIVFKGEIIYGNRI